jgi:SAM-dependent methyltransferase
MENAGGAACFIRSGNLFYAGLGYKQKTERFMTERTLDKQPETKSETKYEKVFGDTFSLYSKKEMEAFIEPFRIRFQRNHLDPVKAFSGKRCFDAGCGNGRGTLFMLMSGAEHVTSYDFSKTNTESARRFVKDFGFSNSEVMQGTLEKIPFADGTFDVVWCNGVIMHTAKPDSTISEIARILRPGGNMWIYVYGSGGLYWRVIQRFRKMLHGVDVNECIAALKLFRYETQYVAEYIDDWFAVYLRCYTDADMAAKLKTLGFSSPERLKYGTDYDTSHRRFVFASSPAEAGLMGEGDLRYWLTKDSPAGCGSFRLSEDEYGSDYKWPDIFAELDRLLDGLEKACGNLVWKKIAACAHIQRELRLIMTRREIFKPDEIHEVIGRIVREAGLSVK